jgi:hypothetical protein
MKITRWLPFLFALCALARGGGDGRPLRRQASDVPPSADFFVASNGNDAWSGTLAAPNATQTDGPFASVAKAQLAARSLLRTNPRHALSVMLRGGTYYLPLSATARGTLLFTSADSGTAAMPVTWENYPGETPVISGGAPIGAGGLGLTWTNVSGSLWQVQLPASAGVFEYLFYNGERRLRARVQSSGSKSVGFYMRGAGCYDSFRKQTADISQCNLGTFLRVAAEVPPTGANAGCPSVTNSELTTESKCLDRFEYDPSDPIAAWSNLNPTAVNGQSCPMTGNGSYPQGDIEITFFDAWSVDVMRVSCVDTANHLVYLTGAMKRMPSTYANFGPSLGHRYMVENVKDAFDAARAAGQSGLWFLDRSKSPWVLNYLANSGENPNADNVTIAQLQPVSTSGGTLISATGLNYAIFRGIVFEVDNFVPLPTGLNTDDNGEGGLPEAIDCESCQNVTFDGVTVRHTSASGLLVASTSGNSGTPAENDTIQNSAFYDLGDSGIRIGHQFSGNDKAANVVQFITAQNNIVQGYSRVFPDGEGIAQLNGHDILYQYNDVNDGYHAGISICNAGCAAPAANGFNIVSQYNHIWNAMQGLTSDGGTLYYGLGGTAGDGPGNKILNNLVHDTTDSSIIDGFQTYPGIGYGGHGIYLDRQTAGVDVENNVVYRVSASTAHMSRGPAQTEPAQLPNTFRNNILAYGLQSLFEEQNPWVNGCYNATNPFADFMNNIFYFDLNESNNFYVIQGCAYSCSAASYSDFHNFQGNLYWRTDGKFAADASAFHVLKGAPSDPTTCYNPSSPSKSWTFLTFSQWQSSAPPATTWGPSGGMNEDKGSTVTVNPGFGSTGAASDFMLSTNPVAGFDYTKTNDTILHAGRNNPVIDPPVVPATFPTYTYQKF